MADKEEVRYTDDYKVSKTGRKIRAHRIIFNKGDDDGKKGITEMKKTYREFVEQHTAELTEEQKNEIVAELQEVLGKDAKAGEWISDFVHSDNPKFAGKSKEKRKEMALAAFYAKQRNEEVELDEVSFSGSHQGKTTLKHVKDPGVQLSMAAHDIKPGVKGYRDRIALLKAAQAQGKLKEDSEIEEELKGNQHKLDKNKNGKLDKHDFKLLRKEDAEQVDEGQSHQSKTTMKHVSNPTAGEKKAAKDIKPGIAGYRDRVAMLKSAQARGALKKEETVDEASVFDYKNNPRQTSDSSKTKTYHDVKKTSTGTVYTKQFDKDGMSKGTGDDAAKKAEGAPKRGRGRPKKDKFAEAVEFLLALSEEHFDDMMEEGFDTFLEDFEQLDELSKSTLGSYIKMATNKIPSGLAVNAHQAGAEPTGSKARKGFLAKAHKRIDGIAKATDRLTK